VGEYLERLEARLKSEGFGGLLAVMRMGGGILPVRIARHSPVQTLHSGPVGGVSGAARVGAALGQHSVITADVGGTSFDVGLVVDGEVTYSTKPMIERQALAIPVVDVTSIGTGGGSIAWLDPSLGTLRVGPQSAGAVPGPACYGRGGTRPTVTDAAVVLGWLDRLGSQLTLDRDAACAAVADGVAGPLGRTLEEAADGILQVACEQMRDLVRRTTLQRGHDPADFVLYAFGGAGPQYAGRFAAGLGVSELVVPSLAAEFSAFGAVASDISVLSERDVVPRPLTQGLGDLDATFAAMVGDATAQLLAAAEGPLAGVEVTVTRSVGLRFLRQVHRIDVPLPAGPVTEDVAKDRLEEFRRRYERIVGEGTAHPETPIELVALTASVALPVAAVMPEAEATPAADAPSGARQSRRAWFDGDWVDCAVVAWSSLGQGDSVEGPVFVESEQTTAVVLPGQRASVDRLGNLRMVLA
jgi:N-methylhydantoinase A